MKIYLLTICSALCTLTCQNNAITVLGAKFVSVRYSISIPSECASIEAVPTEACVYKVPVGTAVEVVAWVEGLTGLNKKDFVKIHWTEDEAPATISRKKAAFKYTCSSHEAARLTVHGKAEALQRAHLSAQSADIHCVIQWVPPKNIDNKESVKEEKGTQIERQRGYQSQRHIIYNGRKGKAEAKHYHQKSNYQVHFNKKTSKMDKSVQSKPQKAYKKTSHSLYFHPSKKEVRHPHIESDEADNEDQFHDFPDRDENLQQKYINIYKELRERTDQNRALKSEQIEFKRLIEQMQKAEQERIELLKREEEEQKKKRQEEEQKKEREEEKKRQEEEPDTGAIAKFTNWISSWWS